MTIRQYNLNFSVVLVRPKIAFFSIQVVFQKTKPLNFDWINCPHDVPVDKLRARRLSNCPFVGPSILKINNLHGITNIKLRSDFVFNILELKLSEKVL